MSTLAGGPREEDRRWALGCPEDAAGLIDSTRGELTGVDRLLRFRLRSRGAASSQTEAPGASPFSGCGAACRQTNPCLALLPAQWQS